MKKLIFSLIAVGSLALVQTSFAALEDFTISLNSAQENNPLNTSPGIGSGTITLDTVANTITLNNISYSGLSANSTLSHFHGPGAPGSNAGVLYNLAGFTTLGGTSGSFSGTVTLTANPNGTSWTIADQISQLENGLWYLNVHSTAFPGGEIRGQVLPVPEPSTLALLGLGIGAAVWRMRQRR